MLMRSCRSRWWGYRYSIFSVLFNVSVYLNFFHYKVLGKEFCLVLAASWYMGFQGQGSDRAGIATYTAAEATLDP